MTRQVPVTEPSTIKTGCGRKGIASVRGRRKPTLVTVGLRVVADRCHVLITVGVADGETKRPRQDRDVCATTNPTGTPVDAIRLICPMRAGRF
jgi:hypothetical protein